MNNGDKPVMPSGGIKQKSVHGDCIVGLNLTKREYAAIAAMQGLMADFSNCAEVFHNKAKERGIKASVFMAIMATEAADALMAALEEG